MSVCVALSAPWPVRDQLGYEPLVRVREGLERSAAWYAEHLGLAPGAQPRGTFRSP